MSKLFFLFGFFVCFSHSSFVQAQTLQLQRVTPSGTNISEANQIVFQFNQPMVPLGKMERDAAEVFVHITPALKCDWRWLNQTALACNLNQEAKLAPATRYDIDVLSDFKSLSGSKLSKNLSYFIETRRPEPVKHMSYGMESVAQQKPRWNIGFSVGADIESIKGRVFFKTENQEIEAEITPIKCYSPDDKCTTYFHVYPKEDLGLDQHYRLMINPGIKASEGGNLTSTFSGQFGEGRTPPAFQVMSLSCYNNEYRRVTYSDAEKSLDNPPVCMADSTVNINLSDKAQMAGISSFVQVSPSLKPTDEDYTSSAITFASTSPGTTYTATVLPGVTDVWGNKLQTEKTFRFSIADRKPELRTQYSTASLEAQEKTDLFGYVSNLNSLDISYTGFTAKNDVKGTYAVKDIDPSIRNVFYPFKYNIREFLDGQSGFLFGSFPFNNSENFYVSVSPWQVIAKTGYLDSLVWVVDMRTGKPVKDATVEIYQQRLDTPRLETTPTSRAETDRTGLAKLAGLESFDPNGVLLNRWSDSEDSLFVKVIKGDDIAVLPLKSSFSRSAGEASNWSVYSAYSVRPDMYLRSFGVTPQSIYRQGDTVDFKIYVRDGKNEMLGEPPFVGYSLAVKDAMGKTVYEQQDLTLSKFGALNGSFKLPEQALLGWYSFELTYQGQTLYPMKVLVTDFTPLPFKVSTEINGEKFYAGDKVNFRSYATLFSGGAFANAKVRQAATLSYQTFSFNGNVGPINGKEYSFYEPYVEGNRRDEILLSTQSERLDEEGEQVKTLEMPNSSKSYGKLRFETKVFDDSGRASAAVKTAEYFSVGRFVGLRMLSNSPEANKPFEIEYIVASSDQKLVADVPVSIVFTSTRKKAVREKTAGNAYMLTYQSEEFEAGRCDGKSAQGAQVCSFTPTEGNIYKATATVTDTKGRMQKSEYSFYVWGQNDVVWENRDNVLKMMPDKAEYKPGDSMTIMVENPMPNGLALVTVERYGILTSFVQELKGSMAKIKIPVTKEFFPGVYVSVSLFSPRVEKPMEGSVDLGKPTEWMGYIKIPVVDDNRRIKISVKPEREEYRPRQKVKVEIKAALPRRVNQPTEAAVVVLDESVLALLPNGIKGYDPYEGLNKLDSLNVRTYSLIERLIGRQNVEKKGANQGGDGGSDFAVRDIFKFVGYWNPSLELDKNGKGSFEMELPDNLTGWRVIVLAAAPNEYVGIGEGRFNVIQPLEIRSLLPNQVRSDDSFTPGITVQNRTKNPMTVTVGMQAKGAMIEPVTSKREITLKPYGHQAVFLDEVKAKLGSAVQKGKIDFRFMVRSENESDGLAKVLPVLNLTTLETAAVYNKTEDKEASVPVVVPDGVYQYGGSIGMSVSPSILNDLANAIIAMRDYPYSCWEQQISRAWAAAIYLRSKDAVSSEDIWPDAEEFIKKTLANSALYQADSGAMGYFQPQHPSPYLSAYTSFVFVQLRARGFEPPIQVEEKLAKYLLDSYGGKKGSRVLAERSYMSLQIELLSLPFLRSRGLLSDSELSWVERELPRMTSFEKALYLYVSPLSKKFRDSMMEATYETSGTFLFHEGADYPLMHTSPAKTNCMALNVLSRETRTDQMTDQVARGVMSLRHKGGSWGDTHANAFCLSAIEEYAFKTEKSDVDMQINAFFDNRDILKADFKARSDKPVSDKIPLASNDAGKSADVRINKEGNGVYYSVVSLSYPSSLDKAVNAGLEIHRKYSVERHGKFIEVNEGDVLQRGELVRIDLQVSVPRWMHFVAISDSVPGGFEPVNRDLATASAFDLTKTDSQTNTYGHGFYYRETGHKSVNFYAETLPQGTYNVSYAAQVIADGTFNAFPAKAEAMYMPDIFGLTKARTVAISGEVRE